MAKQITLETPVLPEGGGNVVNVYEAVIMAMIENAGIILNEIYAAEGNRDTLIAGLNALHSLVANCQQYSFHGCVSYAMKRGNLDLVEQVFRHPLLKVILMYLYSGGLSSGMYIDWTVTVAVSGWLKKEFDMRLDYRLVNYNPTTDVAPSIKMLKGKGR